jgi:hypothetical protein
MRVYGVPASHQRYLKHVIGKALKEIALDLALRADEEPRVRALAGVPDEYVDLAETGIVTVIVGVTGNRIAATDAKLSKVG